MRLQETTIGVRDEYAPKFGRQVLTLWSGSFYSTYEAEAVELPKHDGYMLHIEYGPKVRVTCASPRTNENYESVDAALVAAFEEAVK
jgi:hypothetical protein